MAQNPKRKADKAERKAKAQAKGGTLKNHQPAEPKPLVKVPIVVTSVAEELVREGERGCILVGAAILDERLKDLIASRFVSPDAGEAVLGRRGAGRDFSARIHLAFALALVDEDERDQLDLIRETRNDAAHFQADGGGFRVTFDATSVQERMSTLTIGLQVMLDANPDASPALTARIRFEGFVHEMAYRLWCRATLKAPPFQPRIEYRPLNATVSALAAHVTVPEPSDLFVAVHQGFRIPWGWQPAKVTSGPSDALPDGGKEA